MWILAIHDKIYWLLNDVEYIIGRASKSGNQAIDFPITGDASVSRKHIKLVVRQLTDDAAHHPSIRSEITVTDLDSRFGTKVDDNPLQPGTSTKVPQKTNGMASIKLGKGTKLRLKWDSYVVTYSTGQTGEAHKTLWDHALNLLRPLDIKLMPYIVKSTNVFVKTGKSTSSLYYALTQQIPIANTQFFEALRSAAFENSKSGTRAASVVPDVNPFLPDPSWRPDHRRSSCLSGSVFHLVMPDHAEAIEPILTAAGANCVDQKSAQLYEAVYVVPANYDVANLGAQVPYTFDSSIFAALVECRSLYPSDIRTTNEKITVSKEKLAGPWVQRKRPQNRLDVLEILTSQDPQPETTHEPSPSTGPAISPTPATTPKPPRPAPEPVVQPNTLPAARKRANEPYAAQSKKTTTDREDEEFVSGPSAAATRDLEQDKSDDEVIVLDYDAIGELAVVENTLELRRPSPIPKSSQAKSGSRNNVPNFKAFKRKTYGAIEPMPKIEYDDNTSSAQYDFEDFEDFANDDHHNGLNYNGGLPALAMNSRLHAAPVNPTDSASQDTEERLFVRNDDEDDADNPQNTGSLDSDSDSSMLSEQHFRSATSERRQADDDFGFSFS